MREAAGNNKVTVTLTVREEQVLLELCKGFVRKEIATNLGVSIDTVKFHLKNIRRKVPGCSPMILLHLAMSKGLIPTQAGS
jgi:DNA-binding CsgD family transcriptional regulator